jgi:hypothetical protein
MSSLTVSRILTPPDFEGNSKKSNKKNDKTKKKKAPVPGSFLPH